ncbi:Flagellar basal-body rod protein FlgB [Rhodovastum atsumiense]|uniref:flagellar basal body rod protein FlgB n=1 Tax=Rhodovastum atsumiense TaxID=504468 RepID=UPI00139F2D18|nr:flagellar biosynthesis protein FlgB [Rhodovastum atsumiense]CAH2599180.1 Flagellar basal-body rod protein FlgB [Rhodovastum atsumiense]
MDPTHIGLFDLAERRLAWLDRRSTVLAQNVANADTPGWVPKDLQPFTLALAQAGVTPLRTNLRHLPGTSTEDPAARPVVGERSPDGNAVRLDVELTKVADTETAHMLVGDLWKKYFGLFHTALGR